MGVTDGLPVETATVFWPEFGLEKYDSGEMAKAIRRWRKNVERGKVLSYGELGFQSKIMHDNIDDKRLHSVRTGFIGIKIASMECKGNAIEVKYSLMPSCEEISYCNGKYHLVPRVKKFKHHFELITIDAELD